MDKISNGQNVEWTESRMDKTPSIDRMKFLHGHQSEIFTSEKDKTFSSKKNKFEKYFIA